MMPLAATELPPRAAPRIAPQPLTRFENWPLRLDQAIEAARQRPFAWGTHDCCSFAAGVVQALTGHDAFAQFTASFGVYTDERGALRALAAADGVAAIATAHLGDPIPVAQARRGDVVMVMMAAPSLDVAPEATLASAALMPASARVLTPDDDLPTRAPRPGRPSLAVCVGTRCVAPGPAGLVWLPLREATCAWRV